MAMHNPPHPGEFIYQVYMEPAGLSSRRVAGALRVSPSTLNRLIRGKSRVTPEMALRLSRVFGRSPESWLAMQDAHDLWQARQTAELDGLERLDIDAA